MTRLLALLRRHEGQMTTALVVGGRDWRLPELKGYVYKDAGDEARAGTIAWRTD